MRKWIKQKSNKRTKRTLLVISFLIACSAITFLSISVFNGGLTNKEKEVAYYNEGMDLYVNVINNYQNYVSNTMGVAYAIYDTLPEGVDKDEFKDGIFKLSAVTYSYNTEMASSEVEKLIVKPCVDETLLATPIEMYRDQKHDLDIAIVQYNNYATEHNLRTITNYDSIRLLINDRTTKDKILNGEGE